MLFISHNLAVVRHLSHRILVMYSGKLVEIAARDALFSSPIHPYTRALLAAVPSVAPRAGAGGPVCAQPQAELPAHLGCAYRDRCPHAVAVCAASAPPLEQVAPGHRVACHRARDLIRAGSSCI